MVARIYLVGTDTGIGKTTLACALLRAATASHLTILPFKPAQSGSDSPSDARRLQQAAGLPDALADHLAPHRFDAPLAPGVAERRAAFVERRATCSFTPLRDAQRGLEALERRHPAARLSLIEGAGGLHVPMPGGTWQLDWIRGLAAVPLVVGRTGLGTINHTLLTLDALLRAGLPPLGFIFCDASAAPDPSSADNPAIVSQARPSIPCLGRLPYAADPDPVAPPDLLASILRALDRRSAMTR